MAVMRGLTILVLVCIAATPTLVVTQSPNGLPRPDGYPVTPTMDYGPTPPCYLNSVRFTCEWYGFSYILYPQNGADCLATTREVLANTTLAPPGFLQPYHYYYLHEFVFNTITNTSYCLYGCFDMSASSPVASPPLGFAPPPSVFSPPPVADAPPPSLIAPSTDPSASPPDSSTTPPAAMPPALSSPPAPRGGGGTIINLNGAGFLRPTGLVSFIISGALLVLNGLVAF